MHEQRGNDIGAGDGAAGWDKPQRKVSPTLIGFLVIAVLAIIFIVENGDEAKIRLIIPAVHTPVWVAIAISMVVGVILDRLFLSWWRRRRER